MKRILNWSLLLTITSFIFAGCSKEPLNKLTDDESRIYVTDHDASVNFSDYNTYSIADSVALIADGPGQMQLDNTDAAYIDAVKKYMNVNGYMLVAKDQNPDLGVNVNRIENTTTGIINYGDYWGNYGGYWDPYYWGYPSYGYYTPSYYGLYQVREKALSVEMLDLKNAPANKKIDIIWTGLIRGSGLFNPAIADSQVKALFDQSTYLKTN